LNNFLWLQCCNRTAEMHLHVKHSFPNPLQGWGINSIKAISGLLWFNFPTSSTLKICLNSFNIGELLITSLKLVTWWTKKQLLILHFAVCDFCINTTSTYILWISTIHTKLLPGTQTTEREWLNHKMCQGLDKEVPLT